MNAKFIDALDESLQSDEIYHTKDSATLRSVAITEGVSLQSIVLDKALQTVSDKYKKHLKIIRPALDQLLKMVEENHEASGLKELLAVHNPDSKISFVVSFVFFILQAPGMAIDFINHCLHSGCPDPPCGLLFWPVFPNRRTHLRRGG